MANIIISRITNYQNNQPALISGANQPNNQPARGYKNTKKQNALKAKIEPKNSQSNNTLILQ